MPPGVQLHLHLLSSISKHAAAARSEALQGPEQHSRPKGGMFGHVHLDE